MILISAGQGIFNVRVKDRLQFNILMVRFYNTMDAAKYSSSCTTTAWKGIIIK